VRTVCEPIFQKPLDEISFGQVLLRLFETARRFQMQVQPQLILLQKTLLQIEGLGRQLYPQLDLWTTAKPILEDWAADRLSGRNVAAELRRQLPELGEAFRLLPQALQQFVQQAAEGRFRLGVEQADLAGLRQELRASARRRDATVVAAVTLLGGLVWLAVAPAPWPGVVLCAAGLLGAIVAKRA
jgi:ubiquinone biosynthesis protein